MLKLNPLPLAVAVATFGVSLSTNAATITFGGQTADDNSGLTSYYIQPSQAPTGDGFFYIETFDDTGAGGSTNYNANLVDGCAINSTAAGIAVTPSASDALQLRKGSVIGAAAPADDTTCYAHTPAVDGDIPVPGGAWVDIDYSSFLDAQGDDVAIDYFGFYWGSVDTYNDFSFYDRDDNLLALVTGVALLDALGGQSGNQDDPGSNAYVNLKFAGNDAFSKVRISTFGVAGEMDNLAIGLDSRHIPEPAGLAMLGLGLIGLVGFNRRRKS